eukprot:scaffold36484_cov229-Amphora_coffeaeformis.AAC.3
MEVSHQQNRTAGYPAADSITSTSDTTIPYLIATAYKDTTSYSFEESGKQTHHSSLGVPYHCQICVLLTELLPRLNKNLC